MSTAVPTFDAILNKTAAHLEIPPEVIKNKEYRTRQVTQARHIAAYIARKIAFLTDSQISIHFDQNRENVSMCVRKLERRAANDPTLMNRITGIITELKAG
jgi:chromosomal replication initiation ATPase DnaA